MSKRFSLIGKSPREEPTESFNPYETVNRQSLQEQALYSKNAMPKVIIDDDPVVPNYEVLDTFKNNASHNMKLVVVGDGGCGKTCLLVSYAQNRFPEVYVPTVFENYVTNVMAPSGKVIELALWDTAGQEEYDRLRPLSYPDVDILLICFALDKLVSLQNVKDTWFPEVSHFCPGIPIILVGTKSDLPTEIDPDLPIQVAMEINAIGYIQCSAKTMFNIRTVFNFALNHFQKQIEIQEQYDKSKKRISKLYNGNGHTRNQSSISQKRGHLKNTSYDSTILLDQPLMEDTTTQNPYGNFGGNQPASPKYNQEEFAFTRNDKKKKRSRKCVIL
ncbi:GTP-binding protein [Scheffersomyces xylosifermentans]|uniref:GTP-binding protein n=1 Tax=Scheffersomyces xylosifermentans TaxID=1304137 RepID=UPI00315DAA8A